MYSQGGLSPLNLPSWVMENNSNIGNKEVIICHHSFLCIKATINGLLVASDSHSLLGPTATAVERRREEGAIL